MRNTLILIKHEIINLLRNPAILAVVLLPIFMSKIITTTMKMADQEFLLLSIWILFAQVMVGIMLTGPNLIEEREAKTIDALLCSPLNFGQIIFAKGFAILVLSMFSQIAVYLINEGFNSSIFPLLIPMLVGGIIFVQIGAIIGLKIESSQSGSALSSIVMVSLFLIVSVYELLPEWTHKLFVLIPSIGVTEVLNNLMTYNEFLIYQGSIVLVWVIIFSLWLTNIGRKWTH
ncbi:ABC-2 type transport system permease protein [Keratinibaculum paraultunense]|uniref:ABC-2 type transport system permease protein n=1 Tax=Keratinibaculum paraultunense TaxID=1278232 RepID=A0A4R3KZ82_9FIRM|nr:ABC transporter permease [Keratinibaculum paraultunense]QQY79246.1 ABC transporter permease [Keratinibaculum paraultunense]TCS89376.1 ABC-2 type transport system permease protein [Keratinibaculum paraultunense]